LEKGRTVEWLLNYRGGSFVLPAKKEVIRAIRLGAVCYKPLNEAELFQDLCWVSIGKHDETEVFVFALKEVLT